MAPSLGQLAAELGLPVFPCDARKRPITPHGFKDAAWRREHILALFELPGAALIGVRTGGASCRIVIDIDPKHGGQAWLDAHRHLLPETRTHRTPSGGLHLVFRCDAGGAAEIRNSQGRIAPGVDVRAEGGYACWPPSTGYAVIDDTEPADMPLWLVRQCLPPEPPPIAPPMRTGDATPYGTAALEAECDNIARAPFGQQEHILNSAALKIGRLVAGGELPEGYALQRLLAAARGIPSEPGKPKWRSSEIEKKIRRGFNDGQRKPRAAPLRVVTSKDEKAPPPPEDESAPPPPEDDKIDGFARTEDGIALAFAARHADRLRFDHHAGAWFRWTGQVWQPEETRLAFDWTRDLCRELSTSKKPLGKATTASAVERFAQADRRFAVTSAIWDLDPMKLGTPAGTVDLRTGALAPAVPSDHITKTTAVAPDPLARCSRWRAFLHQATGGDEELIAFLKQFCGYMLTGLTTEHALLFIHGPGGNGKSVFLNTVAGILHHYGKTAPMESFTAASADRHPTDMAMLRGARMVCASETEEGRPWAETRIKQLTGGDVITARFMRQDYFEYKPQFKLVVIGNHKPALRNIDDAMRRRFNIVPFDFRPAEPDPDLESKLREEWPGILRWMIDGCLDWQAHGLVRPQVVLDATAAYFSEQDMVRQWVEEHCDTGGRSISDTTENLFRSWSAYAKASGEDARTKKWLTHTLERQGFEPVKDTPGHRNKRGLLRIAVKLVDTSGQWQNRED